MSAIRGLVVDDDPSVVEWLVTLLQRRCIVADTARDGEEAAYLIKKNAYDLVFLDLLLPTLSGEFILKLMERGTLPRPGAIAVMSAAPNLASIAGTEWAGDAVLLPKPFAAADVSSFVERALAPRARPSRRGVLLGGSGLWAASLGRVLSRRGGKCLQATDVEGVLRLFREESPAAVVIGAPFTAPELVRLASSIRGDAMGANVTLIGALAGDDAALSADLLTIGVDRTVSITRGVSRLSDDLMKATGLARREHRRVPLTSAVLFHCGTGVQIGNAFDLCEGGIGVHTVARPTSPSFDLEFMLPGSDDLVTAKSEIAWSEADPESAKLGVRFTDILPANLERVRRYVSMAGSIA